MTLLSPGHKPPQVTIPAGAQRIDATGKTVIPGLWDMHAHIATPEWGAAYLGVGVTTAATITMPRIA